MMAKSLHPPLTVMHRLVCQYYFMVRLTSEPSDYPDLGIINFTIMCQCKYIENIKSADLLPDVTPGYYLNQ